MIVPIQHRETPAGAPTRSVAPIRHAALLAALLTLAVAAPAESAWKRPVTGPVTRAFDPGRTAFEGGRHRGADLAAPPGTAVRAPCSGRVAFAGPVGSSGLVVTLLCGRWRVTHLPLATVNVRRGAAAARGTVIGTVARSPAHRGLHLGARRDGMQFGYVDPLRFLGAARPGAPPPVGRRGPRQRAPGRSPLPPSPSARPPRVAAPARAAPPQVAAPARADPSPARGGDLAPWPAWAGLALVLAGAGVRLRGVPVRRRTGLEPERAGAGR